MHKFKFSTSECTSQWGVFKETTEIFFKWKFYFYHTKVTVLLIFFFEKTLPHILCSLASNRMCWIKLAKQIMKLMLRYPVIDKQNQEEKAMLGLIPNISLNMEALL